MKKIVIVIAVLYFFVPVVAQAHAPIIEGELLRTWGEVSEEPPRDEVLGMPASYVGGEDYSFEYPYVLGASERSSPYCDITQSRCSFAYLHENDVDVYKFEIAEGQTGFPIFGSGPTRQYIALAAYPPACCAYKDFYPIIGLLGPGLPEIEEELPFEIPEDCKDCGMIRTHPIKVECGERPIFTITTPRYSWFFAVDLETDNIWWEPDPTSPDGGVKPGTYYAVVWEENGIAGEYSGVIGFDEYDDALNRLQVVINAPLVDDMKTTRVKCDIAIGPDPFNVGSYTGNVDCCDDEVSETTTTIPQDGTGDCPAVAIYGTSAAETKLLRHFRDTVLNDIPGGQHVIEAYYALGPEVVKIMEDNRTVKTIVKIAVDAMLPFVKAASP